MRINKPTFEELEPNIPNRKKSVHSRGSGQQGHVRMRHPEHHKQYDEVPQTYAGEMYGEVPCECPPATNTEDCVLDDFKRTVSPPTYSPAAGTPLLFQNYWQATQQAFYLPPNEIGPFTFTTSRAFRRIESFVGSWYTSGGHKPAGYCSGYLTYFGGFIEAEVWNELVVQSVPDNVAGITIGGVITPGSAGGVAPLYGFDVRVSVAKPTAMRSGTVIANIPNGGSLSAAFIPSHLIPAEGGSLWIGVTPGWECDKTRDPIIGIGVCGETTWPYTTGAGNSGGRNYNTWPLHPYVTYTWEVWDTSEIDYGRPNSGTDLGSGCDWGDLGPWEVTTDGTQPTIDGNNLCFTVAAGAQKTMTARLNGASTTNPDDSDTLDYSEPWTNENGVNFKVRFNLTTAGSLTETGTREFSFEWHDTQDLIRGTVYLGDTNHAQGLALFVDDAPSPFVAKDIVEDAWHWLRIDTRNPGYARMKMWRDVGGDGGGEPVAWDVEVARTDDAERPTTDNYLQMTMRLGNMTGADQTLCVDKIVVGGSGAAFRWVVDYLGEGDGITSTFKTSQLFQDGTLFFFVDGLHVMTKTVDLAAGTFTAIQPWPAAVGATLVARYIVSTSTGD